MRKTRLVILPTKCLHQMGFLLLFLSCPVIGDWGRIRPESENSHNAIQIEREGTCGLNRDPPGEFFGFLNENGSKQCRLSEDSDLITSTTIAYTRRSTERQTDFRRNTQEKNSRMSERRNEREVRRTTQRRMVEERRDARTESVRRNVRSRSVEARRSVPTRNVRARSLSLSRTETIRKQRSVPQREIRHENRQSNERLSLARRMNERQNERRADQERRITREQSKERRENDRATSETRDRRTARLQIDRLERSVPKQSRRPERSLSEQSRGRETEVRRQTHERSESRNSPFLRETNERTEIRRKNLERRIPEIRKVERRETTARITRDIERDVDTRFITLSPKLDRRIERFETTKLRRSATIPQNLDNKNQEDFSERVTKWMDLNNYEAFKTGDWTTNCVVGAVVYFLTARQQVKTA